MLSVEAEHFICNEKAEAGAFYVLPEYGKTLSGVKAYPQTKTFFEMAEQIRQAPKLTYQIYVREAGEYEMICYTAPANPVCQGGSVYFGCARQWKCTAKDRDDSGWIPFRRAVLCGMGENGGGSDPRCPCAGHAAERRE